MSKIEGSSSIGSVGAPLTEEKPTPSQLDSLDAWPAPCGDVVTSALIELSSFLRQGQSAERAQKRAAERDKIRHMRGEAESLRDKADAILTSAFVTGGMLAASAGMHALAYGNSVNASEWASGHDSTPLETLFSGGAGVCDRSSDLATRVGDSAATEHDAAGADARTSAAAADSTLQSSKEQLDDLKELTRKAFEAVRAVLQARNAAMNAIFSRM